MTETTFDHKGHTLRLCEERGKTWAYCVECKAVGPDPRNETMWEGQTWEECGGSENTDDFHELFEIYEEEFDEDPPLTKHEKNRIKQKLNKLNNNE